MTPQDAVNWAAELARGRPVTAFGPLAADSAAGHFNSMAPWSWSLQVLDPITVVDNQASYTVDSGDLDPRWSHVHLARWFSEDSEDVRDLQVVAKVPTSDFHELTGFVEAQLDSGDLIVKPWPRPSNGEIGLVGKLAHTEITAANWNTAVLNHPRQYDYVYRLFVLYYVLLYANDQRAGFGRPTPDGQGTEYTGALGNAMVEAQRAAVSNGLTLSSLGLPKVT